MRQQSILIGFAAVLPVALASAEPNALVARQSGSSSSDGDDRPQHEVVCHPDFDFESDVIPPCISIELIEAQCQPNGTQPIHLDAHAQCMCGGSFFVEKLACERCLNINGLRSERDYAHASDILSVASEALCTGTPSAAFADIFSSAQEAQPEPTTGATVTTDRNGGETEVSRYYTPTGEQGAGDITGAAATASPETTTAPSTTSSGGESTTTTTSTGTDTADASEASEAAESSGGDDDSAAMPTAMAGGLVWGAAGVAMMAAL